MIVFIKELESNLIVLLFKYLIFYDVMGLIIVGVSSVE